MIKKTLAALCLTSLAAGAAFAGVSAEEAARLGQDLTPWLDPVATAAL